MKYNTTFHEDEPPASGTARQQQRFHIPSSLLTEDALLNPFWTGGFSSCVVGGDKLLVSSVLTLYVLISVVVLVVAAGGSVSLGDSVRGY